MNHTGSLSLAWLFTALALGCGNDGVPPAASRADLSAAKVARQEAADQAAVAEKAKDKYARDMRKRLDELEPKYADLRARAADAVGPSRRGLAGQLEAVKAKRDLACRKLDALRDCGSDGWQKAKEGFETVLADLNAEFDKAR